jgi:asparagine synthase (glutamine-hydrolysing)
MCGIAGKLLRHEYADLAGIQAMCDQIRHRGPDDQGYHLDGRCGLGMRRLSIIDLQTGHQPISNEDGSLWIVFNGEIYNYQEIRRDLLARGHAFQTNSDTETLIHLYEEEGVEGIRRLRGMFAWALWDSRRQSLLLARDRFGKKPLYYAALPEGFYFASELKCLRAAGVPLELDEEAIRLYLQFSYIPEPRTCFRAVRKLPPGSWMRCHADGRIERDRYWKLPVPPAEPAPGLSEADVCANLRTVFDESVRLRMIADVPLGAFLSGGIDSSLVVASMARHSSAPVKTFSIGFEETEFNELPWAAEVARHCRTDHHEILVRPDSVDLVSRIVRCFDEPFGDSSAIPTFLVSEFAAQQVKVCLSGDGGDELFGGYESFFRVESHQWMDRIPLVARAAISAVADGLPYSAYGKNFLRMMSRPTALERYFENNTAPWFLRRSLFQRDWILPPGDSFLRDAFPDSIPPEDAGTMSQAMYHECTAKLTGDMLVKVDRMSMANSLEVRCPMLDSALAELAMRIPHSWKLKNGKGKAILLKALGDRLPPSILSRGKMGFAVPMAIWFRGPLHELLWDHLTGSRFLGRGIVSGDFLKAMLREHQSGRRDNSHWLWILLMLEMWFREFEDTLIAPSPPPAQLTSCPQ